MNYQLVVVSIIFVVFLFLIQGENQFAAVEHCIFKFRIKTDGIVRTRIDAELTEHAGAQIIFIFHQCFFSSYLFLHQSVFRW